MRPPQVLVDADARSDKFDWFGHLVSCKAAHKILRGASRKSRVPQISPIISSAFVFSTKFFPLPFCKIKIHRFVFPKHVTRPNLHNCPLSLLPKNPRLSTPSQHRRKVMGRLSCRRCKRPGLVLYPVWTIAERGAESRPCDWQVQA